MRPPSSSNDALARRAPEQPPGTVVVDVGNGNGKYGGSIEKPKLVTVYRVNSGRGRIKTLTRNRGAAVHGERVSILRDAAPPREQGLEFLTD